jgi:hypothetical protein
MTDALEYVRSGGTGNPVVNRYNKKGLPTAPFRTEE